MIPTPISDSTRLPYVGVHTLKRMQPEQLAGIGKRHLRERILVHLPVDFDRLYERRIPEDPSTEVEQIAANTATLRSCLDGSTGETYRTRARNAADGSPTFLNRTLRISDGSTVDWYDDRLDDLPMLWQLKLYAFQPLYWLCLGFEPDDPGAQTLHETFDAWIRDWIETVDIGRPGYLRRAWTPWAVSLRILHWSRYLAWRDGGTTTDDSEFEQLFGRELYKNALFLHRHVEWDVGGNHLVENGAALTVAGLLFEEHSWVESGTSILSETAAEQFLDDGYHFERSPMYHVLVLTRYLTVCDLLDRHGRKLDVLETTAEKSVRFLEFLRPPNGRLPLLNDSVYGQSLPMDDCLQYAEAIGTGGRGDGDNRVAPAVPRSGKERSGYHWLRTDAGTMLVDGGSVGPPHLPGHSHSDTLTILLWLDGEPLVTDTGTFGYDTGPLREYARGVRGHNTVQVADTEPIALGGKYLMGPRPEPTTRFEAGDVSLFEGCYEARPYGGPSYAHHRAVYAGTDWWLVRDTVAAHDEEPIRSRLHLHPSVDPAIEATGRIRLATEGNDDTAFVSPLESTTAGITAGWYFPEFGRMCSRSVLELYADGTERTPTTFGFLVTKDSPDRTAVECDSGDGTPTTLQLDGGEYSLPDERLTPHPAVSRPDRPE